MALNMLLNQVKGAIFQDPSTPHQPGYDPTGLIGQIENMFGQFGQRPEAQGLQGVRPASQDPYGDPANQGYGNVRPASQDPYGDPANQ